MTVEMFCSYNVSKFHKSSPNRKSPIEFQPIEKLYATQEFKVMNKGNRMNEELNKTPLKSDLYQVATLIKFLLDFHPTKNIVGKFFMFLRMNERRI